MAVATAGLELPRRSPFGHLWRSLLAGAVSGAVVGVLGAAVGPLRQAAISPSLAEPVVGVPASVLVAGAYAAAVGTIIGAVAGLATLPPRGRLDARLRRSTARILARVVAVPGGLLLFPFWGVSTVSTGVLVSAMLASMLCCGVGIALTARLSLLFVLGPARPVV